MKTYDNYFDVAMHLEMNKPDDFTWKRITSSALAEVMDDAEQKGFEYKLVCYDETVIVRGDAVKVRRRDMVFTRRNKT